MEIPAGIAVNAALTRQAIALEVIKKAADQDRQLVNILQQAVDNVSASNRGRAVDISA